MIATVETIKRGEFVRKITICAACNGDGATDCGPCAACRTQGYTAQAKTFQRGDYCRSSKRYSLVDCEDMNREVWVKHGTRLSIGFTY